MKALLDKELKARDQNYIDRILEHEAEMKKSWEDSLKDFAIRQQKDLVKKQFDETNKAFYKSLSDTIAYQVAGAEMELNSLQHYQSTLKFMLLVFDKGSMAFMSTMGAIDSLNQTLPAFMNNLKSLQGSHSSAVRMMNKFSD